MSQKRPADEVLYNSEIKQRKTKEMGGFQGHEHGFEFVLMPWEDSTKIHFSEPDSHGETITKLMSRWELIEMQLNCDRPIFDAEMLIGVINSYNVVLNKEGKQLRMPWKCLVLKHYFKYMNDQEISEFFEEGGVLSTIRILALQLKSLVSQVKLLKSGYSSSLTLHQMQVASLLANAFMCTFPKRDGRFPSINFNTLYECGKNEIEGFSVEKIKCIVHYFKRIHKKQPFGNITFYRICINEQKFPRWDRTTADLCELNVETQGKIEDQEGHLQMDFANKYVGGGVLGRGCVQEEIRFLICPELIISRLFTECLADNEALLVVGVERFCKYSGYSNTFKFSGDYQDTTPLDDEGRRKTYVIAVDATFFHYPSDQYRESKILRELKKAYVGFRPLHKDKDKDVQLPLVTGNWGCGAFRGDPQLKALLQLMACSQARRNMLYFTFGDVSLKRQIENLYSFLKSNQVNVGMLYRILRLYKEKQKDQSIFEFIHEYIASQTKKSVAKSETIQNQHKKEIARIPESSEEECVLSLMEKASSSKVGQEVPISSNGKTIDKRLSELDVDCDKLEKKLKLNSSACDNNQTSGESLYNQVKNILEAYTSLEDSSSVKNDQPGNSENVASLWFEDETASHSQSKEKGSALLKMENDVLGKGKTVLNSPTESDFFETAKEASELKEFEFTLTPKRSDHKSSKEKRKSYSPSLFSDSESASQDDREKYSPEDVGSNSQSLLSSDKSLVFTKINSKLKFESPSMSVSRKERPNSADKGSKIGTNSPNVDKNSKKLHQTKITDCFLKK